MSPSVNIPFTFKSCLSPSISSYNQVNIPLVVPSAPNNSPPPPTLQVYSRRQPSHRPSADSILVPTPHPPPAPIVEPPTVEPDLPIAIRKGIRSTRNPSPHYTALSYHRLSQPFYTCLSSISSVSIPKSVGDALAHPGWRQAMLDEMNAFQNNGTWELVPLPSRKSVVGCRWVFAIKVGPYGTIDSQSSSCG